METIFCLYLDGVRYELTNCLRTITRNGEKVLQQKGLYEPDEGPPWQKKKAKWLDVPHQEKED